MGDPNATVWGIPFMRLISNIIGFVVPAFQTYKAMKTPGKDDDKQWLTYWVVFSLLSFAEFFIGPKIIIRVPFYWEIKSIFVLWLQVAKVSVIPFFF